MDAALVALAILLLLKVVLVVGTFSAAFWVYRRRESGREATARRSSLALIAVVGIGIFFAYDVGIAFVGHPTTALAFIMPAAVIFPATCVALLVFYLLILNASRRRRPSNA